MALSRKAIYNLLRLAQADGIELPGMQGWEIEDHRPLSIEELMGRLHALGIRVDEKALLAFAESVQSPEELADVLVPDEADDEIHDHAYLILFELWRRLLPSRRPQSIFCNELDELITAWYDEEEGSERDALSAIAQLQAILSDADESGMDPETLFAMISEGCGNNLAGFLYDFGRAQLEDDQGDPAVARDLIGFYQNIVPDSRWMHLLQAALLETEGQEEEASALRLALAAALAEDWSLLVALELITDLLGGGELITALQLIELGLRKAQCNQEAADILEPIVVLVTEIHADEMAEMLTHSWETLIADPLARLQPDMREPLVHLLNLLRNELQRAVEQEEEYEEED